MLCKKGVLRNFAKFTGKHLCQRLFLNLWHRCFPVNFAKFLRTPLLQNTSGLLFVTGHMLQWNHFLHISNVALFSYHTFSTLNFSCVPLFSCYAFSCYTILSYFTFSYCTLSCYSLPCCTNFKFHSFRVACVSCFTFSCCNFQNLQEIKFRPVT